MNKDYYFFINWVDIQKNVYKIGVLARINDIYYLRTIPKDNENNEAFLNGYIGLPGFSAGRLYRSTNKLFDFFRVRVVKNNVSGFDYMDKLSKTKGISFTDSFFVEEMPELYQNHLKKVIDEVEETCIYDLGIAK